MNRALITSAIILLLLTAGPTWGLAANQTVNAIVPDLGSLTLSQNTMAFNFPSIDTWTSDSYTLTSGNFMIYTRHTGVNNPDVVVSSTPLQNGANGPTIPLNGFRIYLAPQNSPESSETLDKLATFPDVGKGRKTAVARYDLTVNADQPAGSYQGTVIFTLVNI